MTSWPAASTRLVALLGWPAGHSLSPAIHNAAFREQGLDLVYLALPVPPETLEVVVAALGAVGAVGANVTVPHKQAVVALCDRLTDEARLVGAVNTLVWGGDGLLGENTDAAGFEQDLRRAADPAPGAAVVVLGTGGAARACAVALGRLQAAVTFVGRRGDAAEEVAALATAAGAPAARSFPLAAAGGVASAVAAAAVVVNATPLGMDGEPLPGPFHDLRPGQVAYDLVYAPPRTPFLAAAEAAGAEAHGGLGMLVAQAAESYRHWTSRDAPLEAMTVAARAALAER